MQAATTQTMTDKDRQAELLQRRILIVGLGATGLSCARFLAAQGARDLAVTDSRDQPPGLPELQTELPDVAVFSGGFESSRPAPAAPKSSATSNCSPVSPRRRCWPSLAPTARAP